jgi:hypothetical protein
MGLVIKNFGAVVVISVGHHWPTIVASVLDEVKLRRCSVPCREATEIHWVRRLDHIDFDDRFSIFERLRRGATSCGAMKMASMTES